MFILLYMYNLQDANINDTINKTEYTNKRKQKMNSGIAKPLKKAMIDKEIKQKEIADILGVSKQTLYNSLSNDNLTFRRAAAIADILNCDIVLIDRETGKIY